MNRTRHLLIVAGLLGLCGLLQVVVIRRATTPALDAARFAEIARSIDREGFLHVAATQREQPLFPAWLGLVQEGLQRTTGEFPSARATSVQLAAAIPLVLAVVPLYLLLLRLVGPAAGLAGSFFFCLLPEVSRLGADGISDSTHLLFFCIAFWAMVEYLESRKAESGKWKEEGGREEEKSGGWVSPPLWLLLAGAATAVAALARVEVLVLAAALGLTLAAFQLLPGRRDAWGSLAAASACFLLGLALVWTPYLAMVGAATPRAAVARILGRYEVEQQVAEPAAAAAAQSWKLPGGEPMSFDLKEPSTSLRRRGYAAAAVRFGRKLADALGFWIGSLALWGAWRLRPAARARRQGRLSMGRASAGDRFVQVFFLLFALAAVRFSAAEGYLDPRHLLALVVAVMGAAGCGALELGSLLTEVAMGVCPPSLRRRWKRGTPTGRQPETPRRRQTAKYPAIAWAVVAVAGACCLPQTLVRLHFSRLGHRAAGEWLAGQTALPGAVLDTQGWTGLYSGRETYAYRSARTALSDPHLAYVVLEGRELEYRSGRSRTLRRLIEAAARPVAEFPRPSARKPNQNPVLVYRWYPERFTEQIRAAAVGSVGALNDPPRGAIDTAGGVETGIAARAGLSVDSRAALREVGPQPRW